MKDKTTKNNSMPGRTVAGDSGGKKSKNNLICVIRIKGRVGIKRDVEEALYRLRLRKKYSCVVIKSNKKNLGVLKKLRDYVAFGEINKEVYDKLKNKRGKKVP